MGVVRHIGDNDAAGIWRLGRRRLCSGCYGICLLVCGAVFSKYRTGLTEKFIGGVIVDFDGRIAIAVCREILPAVPPCIIRCRRIVDRGSRFFVVIKAAVSRLNKYLVAEGQCFAGLSSAKRRMEVNGVAVVEFWLGIPVIRVGAGKNNGPPFVQTGG